MMIVIAIIFSVLLHWAYDNFQATSSANLPISKPTKNSVVVLDDIDDEPAPLEEWIPPLKIPEAAFLNTKEEEYYHKSTWDSSKTLEQNRKTLTHTFMNTCIDPVEDFLSTDKGIILKLASQQEGIILESAGIEEIRKQDLVEIFYLMTNSPIFCRLMRALIAKYKTMPYRPQRVVLLFTKGEANLSSYNTLHYVLNIRTMDQSILSALDCTKHKLSFGGTIFHEMLHWYHKISDPIAEGKRHKSTACIARRLRHYKSPYFLKRYGNYAVSCFSNDEEYYTICGIKEENGELVFDTLCEAIYTYEQYGYVRGSHTVFQKFSDERNFIINARDVSLLKLFQSKYLPQFGNGEFKCSDLSDN
ncbi:MAG: hypothetical protein LBB25_03210 [Holosporaceae bacterium]|nr:hypothetical protein [Holosporaceae bacterium]